MLPSTSTAVFARTCASLRGACALPRAVLALELAHGELSATQRARIERDGELVLLAPPPVELRSGAVGALCRLLRLSPLPGGMDLMLLEGLGRVRVVAPDGEPGHVLVEPSEDRGDLGERARELARRALELAGGPQAEAGPARELARALQGEDLLPAEVADLLGARASLAPAERWRLLEEPEVERRLELLVQALGRPAEARAVRVPLPRSGEAAREDVGELRERIARAPLSAVARRATERELDHLARLAPHSADASRVRSWLEWACELPWERWAAPPRPEEGADASFARVTEALERSHAALPDVKNRVAEFLAVQHLGGAARGTVLCFCGPPGTGKTSMGKAVAEALGRPFVHVPIGGVSDESELRGRHHAQPDALPGRILQGVARAECADPVVLIDEIDKLAIGGEAGSAGVLLELLDPEQNREFFDHFLGVPFDLSRCIFLATANDTEELPEALLDRLEVIHFGSYTEAEKLTIARRHLLPRALAGAGLREDQLRLTPGALLRVVRSYTEEAGVRQLARTLDALARKAAVRVVRSQEGLRVGVRNLREILGPALVDEDLRLRQPRVGVATGLAWTSAGGSMLPIEALAMKGEARVTLTGSLGEVLRESVQTAMSWVRSRLRDLGLKPDALETLDVHLHFPSSATPKDGPSAGVAIAVALVSLLTRTPVRHDVALTGELSLHGAVLPVGGLREKLLAALRAGIRTAVVPRRNGDEILRLPPEVRQRIEIHLVDQVQEAVALALKPGKRASDLALFQGRGRRRARRAAARGGRRPSRKRRSG